MIKKYNQYIKENLLDKLEGPTEEEFLKGIIKNSPDKILELSCEENILIGVKYAVEKGANINKSYNNYFGNTSICFAVNNENYEMVKYLIEHSADINVDENYPLYSALETQNYDISKLLFETGIKYHEKTKDNIIQMYNIPGYYSDDIKKLIEEYILNKPTTESLLSKLEGPTEEELFNNIKNNPEKLFDMGVELNKKEWIILSFKKDKEQNYKNSGFCSFNDIADFFEKYKLSDDEKIEILDLLKTETQMLKVSIRSGFVKGIIYSIKRGADVNNISPNLYIGVVRRNDIGVLKTLIENGLNDEIISILKKEAENSNRYGLNDEIISILKKEAENSNSYELKNDFSNYIKTYESLLNKLEGPTKEEILDNIIKSNNPFDSLLKCISLDYQEGIDFIIKSFPDDSKIQGLKDWYNGYIKRWFSEKMDLTEVVDNNHIIKPTEDDNGNDLNVKNDADNLYYVNKYTGEVYLEVCFDEGEENYYYDYDIFYPKISNDSRLYWKHSENVIQGLTKYYFNEIPSHSSFSVLKDLEYKE